MIVTDENALICDFADTYHIYDYKSLPIKRVAIFAVGLRDDSRIKLKISGVKQSLGTLLLAAIVDRLSLLLWSKTTNGQKGLKKPDSILEKLNGSEKESEVIGFVSGEDFEKTRKEILGLEVE